jgi:hypothetical protein
MAAVPWPGAAARWQQVLLTGSISVNNPVNAEAGQRERGGGRLCHPPGEARSQR